MPNGADNSATCFVISPIGEEGTPDRKQADDVLRFIITPPVVECGFKPLRADQISKPGIITSQVIQHIVGDPLVIADLTAHNPNVFYELALRHGMRKPVIHIIRKDWPLPFDVAPSRTVIFDPQDLESVDRAKSEIGQQIRSIQKDPTDFDTPLSAAIEIQLLRQSTDPQQQASAEILAAIQTISARLGVWSASSAMSEPCGVKSQVFCHPRWLVTWDRSAEPSELGRLAACL